MTIIITHINRYGIVHGADSNLTEFNPFTNQVIRYIPNVRKLFLLPNTGAAVTVAGNWTVDGQDMDVWMSTFIDVQEAGAKISLRQFASALKDEWLSNIAPSNRQYTNWAHIAGYVQNGERYHPEFWAVNNILSQEPDPFVPDLGQFHRWEDLSTKDCRLLRPWTSGIRRDLYSAFYSGDSTESFTYINGHPNGRGFYNLFAQVETHKDLLGPVVASFVIRKDVFGDLLPYDEQPPAEQLLRLVEKMESMKQQSRPSTLVETELMVKESIELLGLLFKASGDESIGGTPITYPIKSPPEMITRCADAPMYPEYVLDNNLDSVFEPS